MGQPKVLLVDDEGSVLFGLGHSLRGQGLRLSFAKSAAEALGVLDRERVDVVVTDYLMPGRNGLEFLRDVADWYPDTARIMLSGRADLSVAVEAINGGLVQRFLQKPCDRVELRQAIQQAYAHLALERENRRLMALVRSSPELWSKLQEELAAQAREREVEVPSAAVLPSAGPDEPA